MYLNIFDQDYTKFLGVELGTCIKFSHRQDEKYPQKFIKRTIRDLLYTWKIQ